MVYFLFLDVCFIDVMSFSTLAGSGFGLAEGRDF